MRAIPPALQAHLDTGATTLCWCWRIARGDGTVFGFTDHDRDVVFDGVTYEASAGFTASQIKETVGLNVDNLEVDSAFRSDRLSDADLSAGRYDNAAVEIWRVNWQDSSQRILIRKGSIGEVKRQETAFSAEIRGLAHELNQEQGRKFQFGCDADLGDARCTIDLTLPAFKGDGAVVSVSDNHAFTASGLGAFAGAWFSGGLLTWTSGANNGSKIEVKRHANGTNATLELWHTMPAAIAPGDNFHVTAGCDKTFPTCKAKFGNGVNFRGFPYIPGNDYVTRYPLSADPKLDGSSIFN